MKIYKVRHKATGLFYKPGGINNLGTDGKWYRNRSTYLNTLTRGYTDRIYVYYSSKEYKANKDKFDWCLERGIAKYYNDREFLFEVKLEDFELLEYEVVLTNETVIR